MIRKSMATGTRAMNRLQSNPVYTRFIHCMPASAPPTIARTFLFALLLVATLITSSFAANWSQPEQELARKIAAVTGPGAISFDLRNQSSLSRKDVDEITRGLRGQLEAAGLRFVTPEQAAASIAITLSENLQNFVWVAEIHQGTNEPVIVVVAFPRSTTASALHEPSPLIIRKTPLWSQEDRILDVAVF